MVLAGLDISSVAAGWSVFDRTGRVVACGTYRPQGADVWARLAAFMYWFDGFLREHRPTAVAIEQPIRSDAKKKRRGRITDSSGRGVAVEQMVSIVPVSTARALYAFAGTAQAICRIHRINCREVHQQTWRKAFGVGSAAGHLSEGQRKDWLKARAFEIATRIGAKPDSEDAAEAVGVGFWLYGDLCRAGREARGKIAAEALFRRNAA